MTLKVILNSLNFKKMSRMIILKILVENKFLKLFLKLECLHHNYRVLTHICLSVELLSLNKITQECYVQGS